MDKKECLQRTIENWIVDDNNKEYAEKVINCDHELNVEEGVLDFVGCRKCGFFALYGSGYLLKHFKEFIRDERAVQ